jgi:hypothetical protein
MTETPGIEPSVPPSGTGCVECDAAGGWWVHLRRCARCGHVGWPGRPGSRPTGGCTSTRPQRGNTWGRDLVL